MQLTASIRAAIGTLSADETPGRYGLLRTVFGFSSLVTFAVMLYGLSGRLLGSVAPNAALPGSTWWVLFWCVGVVAAARLLVRSTGWFDPFLVFSALQVCGGFMENWAHLDLQNVALLLVFASGDIPPRWPLLVLRIQLATGYLLAVALKLVQGPRWRDLSAFETMVQHPVNRYKFPSLSPILYQGLDLSGLVLESVAGLSLLCWVSGSRPLLRRVGLIASVLLHVGISLVIPVGVFLFAMLPFWVAFSDRSAPSARLRVALLILLGLALISVSLVHQGPLHLI